MKEISDLLLEWSLSEVEILEKAKIRGSPRRSVERYLVKGPERLYVLEKINGWKVKRKEEQAGILDVLTGEGLPVERYVLAGNGRYVLKNRGFWTLKEYVRGGPPPRPDFIYDGRRGKEAAGFLTSMRGAALENELHVDSAHMPSFIESLMRRIGRKGRGKYTDIIEVYDDMKPFLKKWESLPHGFTHGDFHPMNIIWGEERINAVIDWEFMGFKPEMYDAAMMLGCIGIEDAKGLFSPFAEEFLSTLKNGDFTAESWNMLPELIISTRFAWLDEWIRNKDEDMLKSEVSYIRTLSENLEGLRSYLS